MHIGSVSGPCTRMYVWQKGMKLRATLLVLVVLLLCVLAGCNGAVDERASLAPGTELLSVDFRTGQVLRYKFVSSRQVTIDWGQMRKGSGKGKSKLDKSSESLDMVVELRPVEIDPYGLSTVKAKCESIKLKRSGNPGRRSSGRDAAGTFRGKSWTFKVSPIGKIEDYTKFYDLLQQAGAKAIRANRSQGTIKDPDMIYDVIALQWFLWDSISSVENPAEGVALGDEWHSRLSIPGPMILRAARDVTYELAEVRDSNDGRLAVIHSSFAPTSSVPRSWPVPYSEPFMMSGMFGFLRSYKVASLDGEGEEIFDIDAGMTRRYEHKYTVQLQASMPLGLGVNPKITIEQTLRMKLLTEKTGVKNQN